MQINGEPVCLDCVDEEFDGNQSIVNERQEEFASLSVFHQRRLLWFKGREGGTIRLKCFPVFAKMYPHCGAGCCSSQVSSSYGLQVDDPNGQMQVPNGLSDGGGDTAFAKRSLA